MSPTLISCHALILLRWIDFVPDPFMSQNSVCSLSRKSTISAVSSSHGLLIFCIASILFWDLAWDHNESRCCFCLETIGFPVLFQQQRVPTPLTSILKIYLSTYSRSKSELCSAENILREFYNLQKIPKLCRA